MYASGYGNITSIECVKLFIDSGARIKLQDMNKMTPLMYAIEFVNDISSIDCVKFLIDACADLNLRNKIKIMKLP